MSLQTKPLASSSLAESNVRCLKSLFFVSNVHCSSCVAYITEVLSEVSGVHDIDVSILTHEVRVLHNSETKPSVLAKALIGAAFEVHHVTTYDREGTVISDLDTSAWLSPDSMIFSPEQDHAPTSNTERNQHIANCDACRKEGLNRPATVTEAHGATAASPKDVKKRYASYRSLGAKDLSDTESFVSQTSGAAAGPSAGSDNPQQLHSPRDEEFNARISISGMSCASCVNTVTKEVRQLDIVRDITVNLLTNSATLVYTGPQTNIEKIIDRIEDIGFETSVDEVNKVVPPGPSAYLAEISIGGMTCGSCSATVTRGLEELPFVTDVSVNLLAHSGKVRFVGQDNIDAILEKIDDLGYEASLNSVEPFTLDDEKNIIKKRVVSIRIDGMFCHHCPDLVFGALQGFPDVEFERTLSLQNPILKITYIPNPPSLTIRTILQAIEAAHHAFRATVYHPPSVEDRSRAMQLHEQRRLLIRFIFVLLVAIPTFLIGIVFMSLVSPTNRVRKYLEQPMWVGSVSRIEWALFIMTTPVMFYGTDIFHVRAIKEISSLWRPGSRVPILQRFYRFGSMNLLISAGTTVAYVSSLAILIMDAVSDTSVSTHTSTYFDSVVFLTLFILAGRYMEAYSKARTGDAVASLGKLRPSEALLVENLSASGQPSPNETQRRIGIDLLEVGDVVSIPHGASPPADGTIVGQNSYQFDESSLTGESKPVHKTTGDHVYTGSVNVGQPVKIQVTALGGSSMLDQIINVVREGQSKRAPLERVADILTSHFVPVITLIAILTFLIWLSLGLSGALPDDYLDVARGGWTFWSVEFAIAVFVVACPCGLALAAPTALFVGGGLAAKQGILVKGGGEAFQEASRLNAVIFDKTGTLTEGGQLKVSDHEVLLSNDEQIHIAWALAQKLEESSNHPIAQAVSDFCQGKSTLSVLSSDIEEKSGRGMRGTFTVAIESTASKSNATATYEAAIGNEDLLRSLVSPDANTSHISSLLLKYQSLGKSTAILSLRKIEPTSADKSYFVPALVFATTDSIRQDASKVIAELRKRQVDVFMCTGDNKTTAYAVADMVGIPRSNVMANVMPAGKADFVRKVQDGLYPVRYDDAAESQKNRTGAHSIVAFVGDGVNDSPALAAADVSIAMASGSDVAMNSASFILLNSDLDTILQLVLLSRRVFKRVKLNFGWAVVYNLCLVPVAAGVFYPIVSGHKQMWMGGELVTVNEHWRLSPVWAALAMALSSISVICSSLALAIDGQKIRKILGLSRR
ncbi:putative copper resistance-associated P-type ATPase [Aspergillus clavatus NRRL 1]|uniref:Copper resistance-associated P-type ATPase, putative n=1 Tax=Aspergillus clavatus (strain ATCC 1007 / CBS 513.65 / DSM 816 / NCTC 3887 / NRRL 1 / QM 1276 / 107) TaxID=344612 RepID=A1CL19_ASPCL|nr:copper resistance-associated P-type ATPase, putative [Aspergillus clavatus NRRL 1]EAW09843.1 copper resistance-associated P-type ATPase, putative [Aspergillus clavatus NRRL 1]